MSFEDSCMIGTDIMVCHDDDDDNDDVDDDITIPVANYFTDFLTAGYTY
jgi:hypothetical protein